MNDPTMQLSGCGPVDGFCSDLSSSRGEIHGQTALGIMSKNLLTAREQPNMAILFYGDNEGVQRKCQALSLNKLCDHRQPNHDLYLEYHNAARSLNKKIKWVKGHQDGGTKWKNIQDLKHLKLTPAAYLNIWCDNIATREREHSTSIPDADVLPIEKWALYSCSPITWKITGHLEKGIHDTMYTELICDYLRKNMLCVLQSLTA